MCEHRGCQALATVDELMVREESAATHPQIVVGIRDPHDCDAALGFAVEEAALRGASLIVVHAWRHPGWAKPPVPGFRRDAVLPPSANEIQENVARQLEQPLATWLDKYPT
jgi:hypothetical protein